MDSTLIEQKPTEQSPDKIKPADQHESWIGGRGVNKLHKYHVPTGGVLGYIADIGGGAAALTALSLEDFSLKESAGNALKSVGSLGSRLADTALEATVGKILESSEGDPITFNLPRFGVPSLIRKIRNEAEEKEPQSLDWQAYGHPDVIDTLRNGEKDPDEKVYILVLGGGQAGNNSAGVMLGMMDAGVLKNVDGFLGISAGVPNILAYAAEQAESAATIYRKNNTENNNLVLLPKDPVGRINKLRKILTNGGEPIMDTTFVARCLREPDKYPLDVKTIRLFDKELLAVVIDAQTGEPKVLDLKTQNDPIAAMDAAICVPGISTVPSVTLEDGRNYADSFFADPIPLDVARGRSKKVKVLIISPNRLETNDGYLGDLQPFVHARLTKRKSYRYGRQVVDDVRNTRSNYRKALKRVYDAIVAADPNFRVAVIEPQNNIINPICDDAQKLEAAFWESREYGRDLFARGA